VIVIADTGALYALVDASDAWHKRIVTWWKQNRDPVTIPVCVLPEVTYLLHNRISPDAERAFIRSIVEGEIGLEPLEDVDMARADTLMRKYDDLGFVDTTIVATAERLDAVEILTTDRRHFAKVRPTHVGAFTLSP
jgi:predicted nucleic acid-binding protein